MTTTIRHFNPFNGKCIHGQDGAKITGGLMKSRQCPVCYPELAHTCPYFEELFGSDGLCTCSTEQTQECHNDI